MIRKLLLIVLVVTILIVFYYSWIPDPNMNNESYLPEWLKEWSNENYNLRTLIPFLGFGFILEAYLNPNLYATNPAKSNLLFLQNIGIAAFVITIAEVGQFLLINRSPDIMDIYYGIIGSLIGGLIFKVLFYLKTALFKNT